VGDGSHLIDSRETEARARGIVADGLDVSSANRLVVPGTLSDRRGYLTGRINQTAPGDENCALDLKMCPFAIDLPVS
jgi:hypothetical protein